MFYKNRNIYNFICGAIIICFAAVNVISLPAFVTSFLMLKSLPRFLIGVLLIGIIAFRPSASIAVPAFPGAEGFGVQTTGGRGGKVVKVTNLLDYNSDPKVKEPAIPGSFRWAVEGDLPWPQIDDDPKIIIFEVSGIIRVKSPLKIGSNTTVAGQTSPAGITFYNWRRDGFPQNDNIDESAENGCISLENNVIVRHVRIRGSLYKGRCVGANGTGAQIRNIILDHISCSWAGDETMTFWDNCRDITVQWCTIEESVGFWHGEGAHNDGILIGSYGESSGNFSVHHTLFSHHHNRCPLAETGPDLMIDVRNCVQYNANGVTLTCGSDPNGPWSGNHNIIGNYMKFGPTLFEHEPNNLFVGISKNDQDLWAPKIYMHGNIRVSRNFNIRENTWGSWAPASAGGPGTPFWMDEPVPCPEITTHTAEEAYELVLAHAGAWPRDSTTRRTILEVKTGTGSWKCMDTARAREWGLYANYGVLYKDDPNDWPDLPPPLDSDNDGMPNAWETAHGLNPSVNDCNGTDLSTGGYTNIEVYINALADSLVGYVPPVASIKSENYGNSDYKGFISNVYPNPFISFTSIGFTIPERSQSFSLKIFSLQGNIIKELAHGNDLAGQFSVNWNGKDNRGRPVSAGNYVYQLRLGNNIINEKIIILR
ncbi:MAG: FlgD immunoglobulin-like domain containing protein [bacterium]